MALCLGTAQLGQSYGGFRKPKKEVALEILAAVVECGIEYIDTAPSYGDSEKIIGEFLKANPAKVKIITKIPKYAGKDSKGFIDHCKASALQSMRMLGRSQLWAVLLHDPQNAKDFGNEILGLKTWFMISGVAPKFGVSLYEPSDIAHRFLGIYQIPLNVRDTRFLKVPSEDFFWGGNVIMVRSIYLQGTIDNKTQAMAFAKKAIEKKTRHNMIVFGAVEPSQVRANAEIYRVAEMNDEQYEDIMKAAENPDLEKIDPRRWGQK